MTLTALRADARRRRPRGREAAAALLQRPRYELVPLHGAIDQAHLLPDGATVTVTSSPRRGPEATISLAEELADLGFRAVPHLAARTIRDEAELTQILDRLHAAAIDDIFVVGGDAEGPAGDFPDGAALLEAISRLGYRFSHVGVPAYPEGHHLIDDEALWAALKAKSAYATYVVTQLCFDAETICRYVAAMRERGIELPVVVGIPGAVDVAKLLRISVQVGVGESLKFVRGNAAVARRLLRPVGYRPTGLVRKLGPRVGRGGCDIAGLHIYTFNQVGPTVGWVHKALLGGRRGAYTEVSHDELGH
jgi:methylenetetrahydrofolate reductase (NADPH)